jgi:hypothetical protein
MVVLAVVVVVTTVGSEGQPRDSREVLDRG